ncbi:MAG: hypothetical protein ACFFC7_23130, partial [Candidatus Hermodarchaeota archaeon]
GYLSGTDTIIHWHGQEKYLTSGEYLCFTVDSAVYAVAKTFDDSESALASILYNDLSVNMYIFSS